jgi:hypothetical protein
MSAKADEKNSLDPALLLTVMRDVGFKPPRDLPTLKISRERKP